ncbi:RNA polymerase sigma-70 factor [Microseira wollei]|uniref:RNA polymerase sigma-70 factor, ECF subfamily protein n=1 Tax=Microseira wollei NIES-4236 TaxID=2530354 RepID=A0AAV3XMY9_9CYAN|nr:RNA polymerase sigma-70 factor [Microseira wollei]GET41545.1 RNA polymerase sigma-70 factor, ECF subfamily protein [Microseira wollei NIES-4236]
MERLEIFNQHRSLLFAIAYRMLGSATDAEDMVQEAWIRWQLTQAIAQSPKAFLSSLITRLCIDRLRSARVQREKYVGIWLPEPLMTDGINALGDNAELAESLSFAFLMLLECLSPTERAIFLLREVFDYDYSEIAKTVGKSIPNCRQIVRRARQHLVIRRPSISLSLEQKEEIIEQFLISWNQGDLHKLIALMAEDITFFSDGGGQVTAAQRPLQGCQKVARFLVAIRRSRLIPTFSSQIVWINHQLGILNTMEGKPQSTFSFEFSGQSIQAIFAVVNPEKLKAVNGI